MYLFGLTILWVGIKSCAVGSVEFRARRVIIIWVGIFALSLGHWPRLKSQLPWSTKCQAFSRCSRQDVYSLMIEYSSRNITRTIGLLS